MRRTQSVSLREACLKLGFRYEGVYRHVRAGRVPHKRLANLILVDPQVLAAVLASIGYTPRKPRETAE